MILRYISDPKQFRSIFKGVPIQELDYVRNMCRDHNIPIRIRYRGPRVNAIGDNRSAYNKQLGCLKRFATNFTVYVA
jgi:hypothetical protein